MGLVSEVCNSFPSGSAVKNPPANAGDSNSIPGSGSSPWRRKWKPTQSSCLWTDDPGRLQSMGSQRVRHKLATEQQTKQQSKVHRTVEQGTGDLSHMLPTNQHFPTFSPLSCLLSLPWYPGPLFLTPSLNHCVLHWTGNTVTLGGACPLPSSSAPSRGRIREQCSLHSISRLSHPGSTTAHLMDNLGDREGQTQSSY